MLCYQAMMAKVLYAVQGNGNGHSVRSLALAVLLEQMGHEVRFVGGGNVLKMIAPLYQVEEVPVLFNIYKNNQVDVLGTMGQITRRVLELKSITKKLLRLIEEWSPDLAICDREFFLPHACKKAGVECISLNHSRILRCSAYEVPENQKQSWRLAMLNDKLFFDFTYHNLAVSFYKPPFKKLKKRFDEVLPPILRPEVFSYTASEGEHILVYQSTNTHGSLMKALKQLQRKVIVYGWSKENFEDGNIHFRAHHPQRILEDLSSCVYAVVNGGHNLISEALYFGKPILALPIRGLFEQYLNSVYLKKLGYGDYFLNDNLNVDVFKQFEENLSEYSRAIAGAKIKGNDIVACRVDEIIRGDKGKLKF